MVAFVASTVLTAANLNSAFNALTIRTVTGTSDTLVLADNGGAVTYSNAAATTSTIPPNSSVAYATGTKIVLVNLGAGVVTVTPGAGVTVGGTLTIAQNAGGTCLKTATNTWSFLPFGSGAYALTAADVTGTTGSPAITTSGIYTIYTWTSSGSMTLGQAGLCSGLIVSAGSGPNSTDGIGGTGGSVFTVSELAAGALTVTIGAGGGFGGSGSLIGTNVAKATPNPRFVSELTGAGATALGTLTGFVSTISGSSVTYAPGKDSTKYGGGATAGGSGANGIVIVRVVT